LCWSWAGTSEGFSIGVGLGPPSLEHFSNFSRWADPLPDAGAEAEEAAAVAAAAAAGAAVVAVVVVVVVVAAAVAAAAAAALVR